MAKLIKAHIQTILITVVFIVGISLLLYPTIANWWNTTKATRAVTDYSNAITNLESAEYDSYYKSAQEYNEKLLYRANRFYPSEEFNDEYSKQLNVTESGILGAISIPSISVNLPIYHGTSEEVLAIGAGHLQGSSLPIGGIGTHSVITGHRGLPSAKLFTDLDQLTEGDFVILSVLNKTLTYEIDTIRIVEPKEVEGLAIDPDKDLLTLVTCTPYGVNSHRMLLTGHRVENIEDWEAVSDASQIDTKMVALFIAIPILVGLFIWLMIYYRKPRGDSDEEDKNNSNQ